MNPGEAPLHADGLHLVGVPGLPEVREGDDLAALIAASVELADGDVVVVAQKIVSKAEGAVVQPEAWESPEDARARLLREETTRVVATSPNAVIVETRQGLVCANAGVDASNVPGGALTLLPRDPDASARRLRKGLWEAAGVDVAAVVSDSFGRPWRLGQTDVAIGCAGLSPLRDERAGNDRQGRSLTATQAAVADELAGAADLVRAKADGVPVVVIRGYSGPRRPDNGARALLRPPADDLFRRGRGVVADVLAGEEAPRTSHPRPPAQEVPSADLDRAVAAGEAAGHGLVEVERLGDEPGLLAVVPREADALVEAGACAGVLVAALADLGHQATHRRAGPGEHGAAVVAVGSPEPPSDEAGRASAPAS